MGNNLPDISQAQIERALARNEELERFAREQFATSGRWLNASLLAINSGGLLVISRVDGTPDPFAAAAFILGVGASVLSGVAMQWSYEALDPKLRFLEKHFMLIKAGAQNTRRRAQLVNARMNKGKRLNLATPALGWISGLLWLAGVARYFIIA